MVAGVLAEAAASSQPCDSSTCSSVRPARSARSRACAIRCSVSSSISESGRSTSRCRSWPASARSRTALGLALLHLAGTLAEVVAELRQRVELRRGLRELVVGLGELALPSRPSPAPGCSPRCRPARRTAPGSASFTFRMSPALLTHRAPRRASRRTRRSPRSRGSRCGWPRGHPRRGRCCARRSVTKSSRADGAVGRLKLGEALAETIDQLVDLLVGHLGRGLLDLRSPCSRLRCQLQARPHLDRGGEDQRLVVLDLLELDLGVADRREVLLADGVAEVRGHGARQELLEHDVAADLGVDDLLRDLALAEARDLDLVARCSGTRGRGPCVNSSTGTSIVSLTVCLSVFSTVVCMWVQPSRHRSLRPRMHGREPRHNAVAPTRCSRPSWRSPTSSPIAPARSRCRIFRHDSEVTWKADAHARSPRRTWRSRR